MLGEDIANVGLKGQVPRSPEQHQQGDSCSQSNNRQSTCRNPEPAFAHISAIAPLRLSDAIRQQHENREVGGKRVVLLIGGDGKEDEHQPGEDPAQNSGAILKIRLISPEVRGRPNYSGKIQAPRKEPDQMERPVQSPRELIVVPGVAPPEKSQKMFIDEIEPEKS